MEKTLGGDRLGSGKKIKVELHNYERSTQDLGYLWRSTISAGTLVPFLHELALPGDNFDINLKCEIMTHPTIGPLFGSYKVQLDVFQAPIRLYHSALHNNTLGIGLNMASIKLPTITMTALAQPATGSDLDNQQINPSSLLAYLGYRGIGFNNTNENGTRTFQALKILAYWDIVKNYYANKQEEIGAVIHTPSTTNIETVDAITINGDTVPQSPTESVVNITGTETIEIQYTGTPPNPTQIIFQTTPHGNQSANSLFGGIIDTGTALQGTFVYGAWGNTTITSWDYRTTQDLNQGKPAVATFPLSNIDQMRSDILAFNIPNTAFDIDNEALTPYHWLTEQPNGIPNILSSQEGLAVKTYQSDLFNNWLNTEWIDGPGGINEITAVDVSGGLLQIDALILARKVYDVLNRIAVSGGSYRDWLDVIYAHESYWQCETPMYMGGLIRELVFQEVVSNSQSEDQPLGTLAGKGVMSNKIKGGEITIKVDEPSYIIGLISLTPRIDYSQGNKWDIHLQTMDDLHKPGLDQIGFQELITEQMAWWDTRYNDTLDTWVTKSAGKQPAWINYMTNINETHGNFAIATNEMFMTLNRRYEVQATGIKDLTTYIDPSKFNFIFAETALDAQNFWAQIAVDITARRKLSARVMPNL